MVGFPLSALVLQAAQAPASQHPPPDLTAEQWRVAARDDINAIHDTLRDNAPFMVVARDSAAMRRWLGDGRVEALSEIRKITDGRSYSYVVRRYVGGFRDGHIGLSMVRGALTPRAPDWPGFAMAWRNGRYEVGWVQPGSEIQAPPVGAILEGCDGVPANALADARLDRVSGDLKLEAERSALAPQLLRDDHYPIAAPQRCTFRVAGVERTWNLNWRTPDKAAFSAATRALIPSRAVFGVSRWGDNAWWIGAPRMSGEADWKALYEAVDQNLATIRNAAVLVIDLRGNGGGSSVYGDHLARRLFGDVVVDADTYPWGDLAFKVGPLSRKWASAVVALEKGDADGLARAKATSDRLDLAPLGSEVVIKETTLTAARREQPHSPMRGRVVMLVDGGCFSACLDTLDLFTRLPGVRLAGSTTGADTIFMDGMQAPLPSGKATLTFGIKAWVQRRRGSNVP